MAFRLTINHKLHTVDVPGDTPLLKGTKYGCGIGMCGACTVQQNGVPIRSCQTAVSAANGPITTIEGLSANGTHPVQLAWADIDVPQCGYCQAGQMMSAAALLAKTPKPTDSQIDSAMTGNLCRCRYLSADSSGDPQGSYAGIVEGACGREARRSCGEACRRRYEIGTGEPCRQLR